MPRSRWLFVAAALACHGPDAASPPADTATPTAAPEPTSAPPDAPPAAPPPGPGPLDDPESGLPPIDTTRRCGEPGFEPQDLPAALQTGQGVLGRGSLRRGERASVGTVQLHYDPDMLVSPTSVGARAPAIAVRIDPSEAGGGPWGGWIEQHAGRAAHLVVGPYRVDTVAAADNLGAQYTVSKRACPDRTVVARQSVPLWMWLSTEAMRSHAFDLRGELLMVTLFGAGDTPRLDVSRLGYSHALEPRPGEQPAIRVGAHRVTVEQVVPGPGSRFTAGTWSADGDVRLHARVRVEPAPPPSFPPAIAATSPCGAPSPARTAVPPDLDRPSSPAGEVRLGDGDEARLGPYALSLQALESPPRPGRGPSRPEVFRSLLVMRDGVHLHSLSPQPGTSVHRVGTDLLTLHSEAGGLRVRRFRLTCPEEQVLSPPAAPVYVWLSTAGAGRLVVGDSARPLLRLNIYADPTRPTLGLASARAHASVTLRPTASGAEALSFDGWLVELVEVVPGRAATYRDDRWHSREAQPPVHVQLRLSRE